MWLQKTTKARKSLKLLESESSEEEYAAEAHFDGNCNSGSASEQNSFSIAKKQQPAIKHWLRFWRGKCEPPAKKYSWFFHRVEIPVLCLISILISITLRMLMLFYVILIFFSATFDSFQVINQMNSV